MSTLGDGNRPPIGDGQTLSALVDRHLTAHPDAPAFTFEDQTFTFREVDRISSTVAQALTDDDFAHQSRIVYIGKNTIDFAFLLLGAARIGVVVAPLNPRLAIAELQAILVDCEPSGILLGEEFAEWSADFENCCTGLQRVWQCGRTRQNSFLQWAERASVTAVQAETDSQTVILQLYTSGTTGKPKGVMLSHDSLVYQRIASERGGAWWDCQEQGDTMILALTISHVGGLQVLVRGLYAGGHTIILSEFAPSAVLGVINRYGAARLVVVPATLQLLLEHSAAITTDFGKLRIVQYGAAPIPLELLKRALALMRCHFVQVYGMTELGGSITALPPVDHDPAGNPRMASVGVALPGVVVKIATKNGQPAGSGEVGEILVRSRAIMAGYWRRPDETEAVLDSDGWYRTGDAGYIDEDGYIFLRDRIKDVICSGAENVYPAEVENALLDHALVAEAAVIGVPDPNWGEAVKAIVVLHDGASASEGELIAFVRERIARFKVPKSIDFADQLPRNSLGKVQRRLLRQPYWDGMDRMIN